MTGVTFSVRVRGDLVAKSLQELDAEIPKIGRQQIYNTVRKIKAAMRKPGKKPTYPIKWDSDKQRRAFFATGGFGRGIPTRRTGQYAAGWEIEKIESGYKVHNKFAGAKHIGGDAYGLSQSSIHKGRWAVLRDETDKAIETLPAEVGANIVTVARRKGLQAQ